MGVSKFRGIIIKELPAGEADKLLTFYTKEHGKFHARAKGARKIKSKLLTGSQIFCYGDFVVFSGSGFNSVTQADIIESFYNIRTDYEKFKTACYIMEVIDKSTYADEPAGEELRLLIRTLQKLCYGDLSERLILRVFLMKYLQLYGYTPVTQSCSGCGAELIGSVFFGKEGAVCKDCLGESEAVRIYPSALCAMEYIINANIKDVYSFAVNDETLDNLSDCVDIFFENLEITIKSKELL